METDSYGAVIQCFNSDMKKVHGKTEESYEPIRLLSVVSSLIEWHDK